MSHNSDSEHFAVVHVQILIFIEFVLNLLFCVIVIRMDGEFQFCEHSFKLLFVYHYFFTTQERRLRENEETFLVDVMFGSIAAGIHFCIFSDEFKMVEDHLIYCINHCINHLPKYPRFDFKLTSPFLYSSTFGIASFL